MVGSGGLALILNKDYLQNGQELRIRRLESYLRSQFSRFFEPLEKSAIS